MALTVNTKNDWGEMFDKFASIPEAKKSGGSDPKRHEEEVAKAKAKQDKPAK